MTQNIHELNENELYEWINDRYAIYSGEHPPSRISTWKDIRGFGFYTGRGCEDEIGVSEPFEDYYKEGSANCRKSFLGALEKIVSERTMKIMKEGFDIESADFLQYAVQLIHHLNTRRLLVKPELDNIARLLSNAVCKTLDINYEKRETYTYIFRERLSVNYNNAYTYIARLLLDIDYPFWEDFWDKMLSDRRTLLFACCPKELSEEKKIERCAQHLTYDVMLDYINSADNIFNAEDKYATVSLSWAEEMKQTWVEEKNQLTKLMDEIKENDNSKGENLKKLAEHLISLLYPTYW